MSLQGDTLQLQRLSFQTASNGSISATGTVRLDPAQGFPVDLAVTPQKALVANRPDLLATASGNIKIAGSSLSGFDVVGADHDRPRRDRDRRVAVRQLSDRRR